MERPTVDGDSPAAGSPVRPSEPLDLVARHAGEQLGATLALVAVERRGELRVCGTWGEGSTALLGRVVQPDGPPATSARLVVGADPLVLSTAAGAPGDEVSCLQSKTVTMPGREPRVLVVVRPRAPEESLHWLRLAAEAVVTAEVAGEQQRLRSGLQEREDERRRWARELHDETLQELGAVQVLLSSTLRRQTPARDGPGDAVEALRLASEMLGRQITGLRHLITELRPAGLDELGLRAPLQALARRVRAVTGIPVHVIVDLPYADGRVATRLLPDIEVAIYRVVQEAVANACRHAAPSQIRVSVVEGDTEVEVRVSDDGRGVDPAPRSAGFGLVGMRERAELAGGWLDVLHVGVYGQPGSGTTVRLVVPARHRLETAEPDAAQPQT